jgi:hypothetical protein
MTQLHRFVSLHILALGVAFASTTAVASGKRIEKAESRAEVTSAGSSGKIVNRTFEAIVEGNVRMLLRKEIQSTFDTEYEQGPGRVRVDAWKLPRTEGQSAIYTILDAGDEIGWLHFPELLTIRIHACCSSSGSRTIFNASTGKMLLYANGEGDQGHLAMVRRQGSVTILIGVHDENGGRVPRAFPAHRDGHMSLLVTAADTANCRRQLLFDLPTPSRLETYVTSVTWEHVKAWRVSGLQIDLAHGETLDGVLKILISDKRTIQVRVTEEGVDASGIVLPTAVKMTDLSECVL